MRKWRENEEMERDSLSTIPHFLFILSLTIIFLYQKLSHLGQNVKYGTFVANFTKKKLNIRAYEEIVLGRIHCKEAPQVVRAWEKDRDI